MITATVVMLSGILIAADALQGVQTGIVLSGQEAESIIASAETETDPDTVHPRMVYFQEAGLQLRTPAEGWVWEKYIPARLMEQINLVVMKRKDTGEEIAVAGIADDEMKIIRSAYGVAGYLERKPGVIAGEIDFFVDDKAYYAFHSLMQVDGIVDRVGWVIVAQVHAYPSLLFVIVSTAPKGMETQVRENALDVMTSIGRCRLRHDRKDAGKKESK